MEKILVTLDGSKESESVLPYITTIARGLSAHITIATAVHYPVTAMFGEELTDWQLVEEIQEGSRNWAKDYLQAKKDELETSGLDVSWVVLEGNPADALLEYAQETHPDLIAMATHGRAGISRVILGSVAQRVLNACESPILLIHPRDEQENDASITEIVVPLDTSELSESVLAISREIAKKLGIRMILVTAIPTEADLYLGVEYMVHPANLIEEAENVSSKYLSEMARKIRREDGLEVRWEILRGDPGTTIVEFARERTDNMVAMSTHGRSGLSRWVLGSVANKVVRSSGDPVIIYKPKQN